MLVCARAVPNETRRRQYETGTLTGGGAALRPASPCAANARADSSVGGTESAAESPIESCPRSCFRVATSSSVRGASSAQAFPCWRSSRVAFGAFSSATRRSAGAADLPSHEDGGGPRCEGRKSASRTRTRRTRQANLGRCCGSWRPGVGCSAVAGRRSRAQCQSPERDCFADRDWWSLSDQ
jgi:hypothetical protein